MKNGKEQYNLRLVFWETTQKCNLTCSHCRMEKESFSDELDTVQAKALIDSIKEFSDPIFVFSGGEPLMRSDIFDLARYAHQNNLKTALATNGTLVNTDIAKEISNSGIKRVSVSIDGADQTTHDFFRNSKGSFNKALEGIDILLNEGISTQINATIAKHNVHQVESIIKLSLSLNIDALHFFLVVPVGCGKYIDESQKFSAKEYEDALLQIYRFSEKYHNEIFIKVTCAPQYYRILKQNSPEQFKIKAGHMQSISKGCLAGTSVCFVSASGNVFPCGYLPAKAGNVLDENFEEIWNNAEVFKNLRDVSKLENNCRDCNYVNACGGCRARAYYNSGDNFMAADQFCVLNNN